jgi:uncharacterized MAPEG superfamily protein
MTIAFWCVFVAILLPYVATLFAKQNMPLSENKAPRLYKDQLEGAEQRAVWAEANQFESFPGFAAAVIIAHVAHADQGVVDCLAMGYIAARIAYFYLYISDRSTLRSIVWFLALGCMLGQLIGAALTGSA